jgi:hypothetical protein
MLVVLAIVAALSIAFVASIGSKSPRAVKTGLLELKTSLQEARQAAISAGRPVNLVITDSAEQARIQAYLTQPNGTIELDESKPYDKATLTGYMPPVVDKTFEKSFRRYAEFTAKEEPVADEVVPIKSLPALTNFGFSGWSQPLGLGESKFGFNASGFPEILEDGGKRRSAAVGGIWMGIRGLRVNEKGWPYGGVFVTERGVTVAFYKPDSKLDDADFKWQRME